MLTEWLYSVGLYGVDDSDIEREARHRHPVHVAVRTDGYQAFEKFQVPGTRIDNQRGPQRSALL